MTLLPHRTIIIIIVALSVIGLLLGNALINSNKDRKRRGSIIQAQQSKLESYENKIGEQVSRRESVEAELQEVREYYPDLIDSIKQSYDVKIRRLRGLTNTTTTIRITDTLHIADTIIVYKDSTPVVLKNFKKEDEFVSFSGTYWDNKLSYNLTVYDSISLVYHYKRDKLFGRKKLYVDALSHNPYSSVTQLSHIGITSPYSRKFGLGLHAGWSPFIGANISIGVNYNIINF